MNTLAASLLVVLWAGADVPPEALATLGAAYNGSVAQAFEAHCADCHGRMPEGLPAPARTVAEKKGAKARKRLDMTGGFPFGSKWELPRLLREIRKSTGSRDMPPKKYLAQKGVAPSDAERAAIVEWATRGEALLAPP